MNSVAITGTGLYTPPDTVSNEALVAAFNRYVEQYNEENAAAIAAGSITPLQPSSAEFIVKASGIRSRHAVDGSGIVDAGRLCPQIERRDNDQPSLMCEMGVAAARQALAAAGREAGEVDAIIVACSNLQRPYPAIAVEIQNALGAGGYGYDMNVACASAAFGVQAAVDALRNGSARAVLVISPEICTGHLNFRDRDSHFIFGDACTALLLEAFDGPLPTGAFEVLGTRLKTSFSNNIRNNFGFLNRAEEPPREPRDLLFVQEGRKVFKEVVPMVAALLTGHLADLDIAPDAVRRFFLHQANLSMNQLIARRVLGREAAPDEAPVILDEYGNTSSAGSVIAFHKHHADLAAGDVVALCAFGAGYSAGSVILRRH